eukprot:TRINITY_DN27575_c0_g4_i1.p1 TRINITY_DN27575_c0_g4~~TRINITY_DN27575_c0_g4_i1.p1  ORF type:complete len:251 (-),score=28.43 TRINITY_DN27575_c0_g4_i1:181-933(-)
MNFISHWPSECYYVRQRATGLRLDHALGNLDSDLSRLKIVRPVDKQTIIYKGSQWHVITRDLIKYVIASTDNVSRRWMLYFTNFWIPDEHFFQTMMCNTPFLRDKIVDEDWHWTDWTKSIVKRQRKIERHDMGPVIIINDDLLYPALYSNKMFVRRLKKESSSRILDMIDSFLLTGEIELNLQTLSTKHKNQNVTITQDELIQRVLERMDELKEQGGACTPVSYNVFSMETGQLCSYWQKFLVFLGLATT